ncbi:hypothetical protein L6164_002550 [Bauhinia variegata]|uniref:Uncharacterized protein n=1 Tax=Bauhinia variegata TaxID=167791 RepID=A0ACB9Q415_BAUVA|nr:hypothetical protein L6164_002550 [Bauhinia variegata]
MFVVSAGVSTDCVDKGGSNLTMISFPCFELDSWTCVCSATAFLLEYTWANLELTRLRWLRYGLFRKLRLKFGHISWNMREIKGFKRFKRFTSIIFHHWNLPQKIRFEREKKEYVDKK